MLEKSRAINTAYELGHIVVKLFKQKCKRRIWWQISGLKLSSVLGLYGGLGFLICGSLLM